MRIRWALALVLSLLAGPLGAQPRPTTAELKAEYLYQFAHYLHWPHPLPAVFTICMLGNTPFWGVLSGVLADQHIDHRPVVVRRLLRPSQAAGCQILFVTAPTPRRLAAALAQLDQDHVLTVSDLQGFCHEGGAIEFLVQHRRLRFIVNLGATGAAQLQVSSALLSVAAQVLPGGGP
jgi:hypothetical protein